MSAWIYRAKDLNIITEHHASTLYKEMAIRGWRTQEPVDYIGDEEPIQLQQMTRRAIAEGLINLDRVISVCPDCLDNDIDHPIEKESPTATELLAMSENDRNSWINQMFEWAAEEDFELFEAYGEEKF